jgi:hypothetical protein
MAIFVRKERVARDFVYGLLQEIRQIPSLGTRGRGHVFT